MKKYYFNGKEFTMDDQKNILSILEEMGLIISKEEYNIPSDPCYYITIVAKKLSKSYNEALQFIKYLINVNKYSAMTVILKEMSRDLDRQYNKSITTYPYFYVFNTLTNSVSKVMSSNISNNYNYTLFAYFRTYEEAKKAVFIAFNIIDEIKKVVIDKDVKQKD